MDQLHFSENIINLRHKKGITQEELADFLGITKASVSKWERKQSLPDILLLPRLASFFDVTVDELLGYEPQLSKEQIQKIYHDLASDFVTLPFEEVMDKSSQLVRKYYSCHTFVFQIGVLWMNHFMLADSQQRQHAVLQKASDLFSHIIADCNEISLCNSAVILKASIDLQFGKNQEVIEILEEMQDPYRLSGQGDGLLIQAYQLAGDLAKAESFTQLSMFLQLITFMSLATQYLSLQSQNPQVCEETISRVDALAEIFHLQQLHPNTAAQFQFQAALYYCLQNDSEKAIKRLKKYASLVSFLLTGENISLHGDEYFTQLDRWFEESELGVDAPRDKRIILDGAIQALNHPAFSILKEQDAFQRIKSTLSERGNSL